MLYNFSDVDIWLISGSLGMGSYKRNSLIYCLLLGWPTSYHIYDGPFNISPPPPAIGEVRKLTTIQNIFSLPLTDSVFYKHSSENPLKISQTHLLFLGQNLSGLLSPY